LNSLSIPSSPSIAACTLAQKILSLAVQFVVMVRFLMSPNLKKKVRQFERATATAAASAAAERQVREAHARRVRPPPCPTSEAGASRGRGAGDGTATGFPSGGGDGDSSGGDGDSGGGGGGGGGGGEEERSLVIRGGERPGSRGSVTHAVAGPPAVPAPAASALAVPRPSEALRREAAAHAAAALQRRDHARRLRTLHGPDPLAGVGVGVVVGLSTLGIGVGFGAREGHDPVTAVAVSRTQSFVAHGSAHGSAKLVRREQVPLLGDSHTAQAFQLSGIGLRVVREGYVP
jgi:hypothetical protein